LENGLTVTWQQGEMFDNDGRQLTTADEHVKIRTVTACKLTN